VAAVARDDLLGSLDGQHLAERRLRVRVVDAAPQGRVARRPVREAGAQVRQADQAGRRLAAPIDPLEDRDVVCPPAPARFEHQRAVAASPGLDALHPGVVV
jgi:hypothetical protein